MAACTATIYLPFHFLADRVKDEFFATWVPSKQTEAEHDERDAVDFIDWTQCGGLRL